MHKNLVLIKKFLFKWFIVGFFLFLFSAILFIFMKDFGAEIAQNWYGIEPEFYFNKAFEMLGCVKLFLFFFVLAPAIAIHWMLCCCKCKEKEEK